MSINGFDPFTDEAAFRLWYDNQARQQNINPNPDDPLHFYDYRGAYHAGASPDETGHWPSTFKLEGHPRMIIGGINTKTGQPVDPQGADQEAYIRQLLGDEPSTAPTPLDVQQPSRFERILEGLQGVDFGPQRGGAASFLSGLVGGLGSSAGARAKVRETSNDMARRLAAAKDAQNLAASQRYKSDRGRLLGDLAKEKRDAERKATEKASEPSAMVNLTAEDVANIPAFKGAKVGEPIRRSTYEERKFAAPKPTEGNDYATQIADAIESGDQPPDLRGLYRYGAPVRAELGKRGYNLRSAQTDWLAVQRTVASLNGPQQTRLRQAAETAYHSLDVIDDLADQLAKAMGTTDVTRLNKAKIDAAIAGAPGFSPEARQIAVQLRAQVNDVTSELGNVYMGGNSPTDHSLELAKTGLSENWGLKQLKSATSLARKNLAIRRNSIYNSLPISPGQQPAGSVTGSSRGAADYLDGLGLK